MSRSYAPIAFTGPVLDAQVQYGSRAAIDRIDAGGFYSVPDPLGIVEREFVAQQDGFYLATVSESGWPYVQFRGGPPGFVTCPDEHTLAWADFRGNRQYISTGNLAHDSRVAMIFMDYAHQRRLKVFGVARISDVHDQGPYSSPLAPPGYRAIVEREVRVQVRAFDWNCPQHITPRYTADEIASTLEPLERRVRELETENHLLRAQVAPSP
ncbi:pyridoxamine 5'-phosphate oxidase family protein [Micromonospora sp. NPDC049523]|uniref:pyridoxamine 5'-phosphate oxidase family protein n=1 Tax=Micromonospora sp. NPDC049523 TaxID=3155921 RepID=UPI0034406637